MYDALYIWKKKSFANFMTLRLYFQFHFTPWKCIIQSTCFYVGNWRMNLAVVEVRFSNVQFTALKNEYHFWPRGLQVLKRCLVARRSKTFHEFHILERAHRAPRDYSRDQPWGSTPDVGGLFQGDLSEKKILWHTYKPMDGRDCWNTDLDFIVLWLESTGS